MTIRYHPAILDPSTRYVRLGYLTPSEGGYILTVGDRAGGDKRGVRLTAEYRSLVDSLDPTVGDREFSAEELGLLGWLADQGCITLMKGDAALEDFTVVPVPRREMAFVEDLDQGCLVRVGDDPPFGLSELGARFLPLIDGERTLGEIAEAVKKDVLADPAWRSSEQQDEEDEVRAFESFLAGEAFIAIRDFTRSGGISFEPAASS
ncbi:hypothetical protein [Auraticoccus monumenti]|uniref:Uncharacterized protein n=1 Tax=Auraticoccus monumenti TaxID=675864 RepID=A0A1G6ZXT9_9ACTN|nr:hypothetical protein [Auraticoccus monumenti]SDE07369.1 hypothetical protein SAMN04489747_2439 [Auraticoccus monumenti]